MPTAYGYTLDEPEAIIEYYRDRLSTAFPLGGIYRDLYRFQSLASREQFHGLVSTVQPGDVVILSSFRALWKKQHSIMTIDKWLRQGVMVAVVDCGVVMNEHTPEGLAASNCIRALAKVTSSKALHHTQPTNRKGDRGITDERFYQFYRWGVVKKYNRKRAQWIYVHDVKTREAMRIIVAMRDRGSSWGSIMRWLNGHRIMRCNKRWTCHKVVQWAYTKEFEFRALEELVKQEKEQQKCAPSATPESVPTNKPATE